MTLELIGAAGEWDGAIAVVVTLFYLANQIRQQNANFELDLHESILDGFVAVNSQLANNQELATLFVRGLYTPDALSDAEATQFQWIFRNYVNCYLKIYRLHQRGVISEADWHGHASHGSVFFNSPGGELWIKSQGDSAFQEFFDVIKSVNLEVPTIDFTMGRTENWK